jgi:hypothetical protein
MRERGDKRIENIERSSLVFLEEVKRLGLQFISGDNPARSILELSGVELSEIGPETTVGDVESIAAFRKKLQLLNEKLRLPWQELKIRVTEQRLPSGVISSAIAQYQRGSLTHFRTFSGMRVTGAGDCFVGSASHESKLI